MEICITDVKDIVANGLNAFRDINPLKHSFNYIANRTNNSPSFVERAAKNSLGDSLDSKKVLALSELVLEGEAKEKVVNYFATKFLDEESDVLKDALYAKFIAEQNSYVPSDLDKLLRDENIYSVYLLVSVKKELKRSDIQKYLGTAGLTALEVLINGNHVNEVNNVLLPRQKYFSPSFQTMKENIKVLSKKYRADLVGKKRNFIQVVSDTTSEEGYLELLSEHKRHLGAIREIKEKHNGNIPYFSFGAMDLLCPNEYFSKEDLS